MKLTKRLALEIARDLWTWLSEDGNREKEDWPGWDKYVVMENECPCCEYVEAKGVKSAERGCGKTCPLTGFAWRKKCLTRPSFFLSWDDWDENRQENAQAMAMACDFALLALDDEKRRGKMSRGKLFLPGGFGEAACMHQCERPKRPPVKKKLYVNMVRWFNEKYYYYFTCDFESLTIESKDYSDRSNCRRGAKRFAKLIGAEIKWEGV